MIGILPMSQAVVFVVSAQMAVVGATPVIPVTRALVAGAATARIMPGISVHLGHPAGSDLAATRPNMPMMTISTAACNADVDDRFRDDRSRVAPKSACRLTEFQ